MISYEYGDQPRLLLCQDLWLSKSDLEEIKAKFLERYPDFKATYNKVDSFYAPVEPQDQNDYEWYAKVRISIPETLSCFLALCDKEGKDPRDYGVSMNLRKRDGVWEIGRTNTTVLDVSREDALKMFDATDPWSSLPSDGKSVRALIRSAQSCELEPQVTTVLRIVAPWAFYASNEGGK